MKAQKTIKLIVVAILLVAALIIIFDKFLPSSEAEALAFSDPTCNVAGIEIYGDILTREAPEYEGADIVTTSWYVTSLLEEAEFTPHIQAIILEIDSYGGSPVAAQEIVDSINYTVTIPVVAYVREAADSAAYWIASAADIIFASELSELGSISVTQSYIDESRLNQLQGYTFNELNTGKFKDTGNPEKPLTLEERAMLQRDLDIVHEYLVQSIAENRGMDIEEVKKLADGSVMLGKMAQESGLIDEIGGYYEVLDYLTQIGIPEPAVCW